MNIIENLISNIQTRTPISFSKYGDGEYNCIFGGGGQNCDNDRYTQKLSKGLLESFIFMSNEKTAYIGKWHADEQKIHNMQNILGHNNTQYADYHSIIMLPPENSPEEHNINIQKAMIYKTIKQSKMKKIIVCNPLLIKSKLLLNADEMVFVKLNNWFDTDFETILQKVSNHITDGLGYNDDGHCNNIVITCCGMGGKVLICELFKKYKNGIYLDFGSAMDKICTKHETRGFTHSYEYLYELLKECIDTNEENEDWNDEKYNSIYECATRHLGTHLTNPF